MDDSVHRDESSGLHILSHQDESDDLANLSHQNNLTSPSHQNKLTNPSQDNPTNSSLQLDMSHPEDSQDSSDALADPREDSSDIDIDTPLAVHSNLPETSFDQSAVRNREDLKRLFNSTCISYYKRRRVFPVCSSHPLLTSSLSCFSNG